MRDNMDRLRKDMEKSGGETVVLSTGLKDKPAGGQSPMDEADEGEEEEEEDDYVRFSEEEEEEDYIDEDEDEEVGRFSF